MRRFVRTNFLSRWLLRRKNRLEIKRAAAEPATPVDKASLIQSFIGDKYALLFERGDAVSVSHSFRAFSQLGSAL
jgi:hypothetical protein